MPTSCQHVINGLDVLHISLGGGGTHFSVFLRPLRRSMQLRAAIPPPAKLSPRREKKADVSERRNLGVKWMVGIAAFAAIAFIWQRLSGRPMLEVI
jgi:hypothetical protein